MSKANNRLIHEKSPYLLQHATNPVDWFPWGQEAFAQAKADDRPIFLSIGYSTCHWCHVMAHESFENAAVASLMNASFVSIKVDREERPDIDQVYMAVCQALTGSGGWPLTIIMTPDKVPFFAATYLPRESRFGQTGLLELIPRISQLWLTDRPSIKETGDKLAAALQQGATLTTGDELDQSILSDTRNELAERFDPTYGGFSDHPKFPSPHNLMFLLRFWKRTGDEDTLHMVEKTLQAMRLGGIYDQIGFGFHRYSTDASWQVPHFEKMLYDQALCIMAYTEGALATGKTEYRRTAEEIITYVIRDLTSPEGGFYSGEDADSEGIEGKFYLWSDEEFRSVVGPELAPVASRLFGVSPAGNFNPDIEGLPPGANVLHMEQPLSDLANHLNMTQTELEQSAETARDRLFAARKTRVNPAKDDKILTDWNGLVITSLARAAQAFGRHDYAAAAATAADFILSQMRDPSGRLLHRYRDGHAGIQANLDDYAFMVWGLLDLYEATFEIHWLEEAMNFHFLLMAHFWDSAAGAFFFTPDDGEKLLVRQKTIYDGAIPSGNSVGLLNILRLARITGEAQLDDKAAELERAFSGRVRQAPSMYTHLMIGLDFALGPSYEIVLTGEHQSHQVQQMLRAIRNRFLPNKVVLFRPAGESPITRIAPFTMGQTPVEGRTTAYVCLNHACRQPATDTETLLKLLDTAPAL